MTRTEQILWGITTFIAYNAMLITFAVFKNGQGNEFKEFALFFVSTIAFGYAARRLLILLGWTPPQQQPEIPPDQTTLNDHTP